MNWRCADSKVICRWVLPVHSGPISNGQSDTTRDQECRPVSDSDTTEALCLEVKVKNHPDQDYVCLLMKGIEEGFRIGVGPDRVFKSAKKNMLSAEENPKAIKDYIDSEVGRGNIVDPILTNDSPQSSHQSHWSYTQETPARKVASDHRSVLP